MLHVVDIIRGSLVIDRLEHLSCVVVWHIGQRIVQCRVTLVVEEVAVEVSRINRILQAECLH